MSLVVKQGGNVEGNSDHLPAFQRWHRAYLDTAELNDISRGRIDAGLLGELFQAFHDHAVILVVSLEHLRDALKPGDKDAPQRLGDALLLFPLRALVIEGPDKIEPWPDPQHPRDIEIAPWANVHEILNAPGATAALKKQAQVQSATFAGDVAVQAAGQRVRGVKTHKTYDTIFVGSTVRLIRGWMGHDIAKVVDAIAAETEIALPADEREAMIKRLEPVVGMMTHLQPLIEAEGADPTDALRNVGRGPDSAPGFWLAGLLAAERIRNVDRKPMPSDSVDLFHIAHIPYVDVATCDRQAYSAISSAVAATRFPRPAKLSRNGQLRELLDHVRTLPTGVELTQANEPPS